METIKSVYYHIKGTPTASEANWQTTGNYIEAEVYYTKGGYSYFTYKNTPRGYFISARKIGRYTTNGIEMISRTLGGEGYKTLIKGTTRKSSKVASEAEKYFNENIDAFIANAFPELELENVA